MDKGKIEDSAQRIELNQANLSGALSLLERDPKKFAKENPLGIRLMQLYSERDTKTSFVDFAKEQIYRLLYIEERSGIVSNHHGALKDLFNQIMTSNINNKIPRTES